MANNIVMSEEQFSRLLESITSTSQNANDEHIDRLAQSIASASIHSAEIYLFIYLSQIAFAKCTFRFDGQRSYEKVEEFINGITTFKKIEDINDKDAVEGLALLFTGTAATWWQGVKSEAKTWDLALKLIRQAFAPKKLPHDVYMELFATKQRDHEPIDEFLCNKRALLAQLPAKRHKEEEQLDLIYGLLNISIRKNVPRTEIKTFTDLLEKARHIEHIQREMEPTVQARVEIKRCTYCGKRGHLQKECRKFKADSIKAPAENTENTIKCYGCGAPGVYRSTCSTCKNKETPPKPVSFYAVHSTLQTSTKIPTIEVSIKGEKGYAHIDTAARTSIASRQLYNTLIRHGTNFIQRPADITLADGTTKTTNLLTTTIDIVIGGRILPITLAVIPEASENRTLLGIDFLETSGIVLNLPQRTWHFIDKPNVHFNFLQLKNEAIPLKTIKRLSFEEPKEELKSISESYSDFMKTHCASEECIP
ncbi:hypothetical protein ABMA27_007673 [Loxostege sticticalis]|uniref:CCHC-type domain-containing protein n=1 Tax=Loxostege sticticalis TaxID=481309 RepID=A0ABR3HGC4_LOXSC